MTLRKRSVQISGHSTSVTLEEPFWDALKEIAAAKGLSLNALVEEIDRTREGNLSSAIRVYALGWFKERPGSAAGVRPSTGSG
ncbi:MAG TPA: ribbon-helix-helix domain-containing protein [Azospirillaceae bacterium]|nr:ribbon-helix-helix domain-containing protein [Azospirillaceae bacterium]